MNLVFFCMKATSKSRRADSSSGKSSSRRGGRDARRTAGETPGLPLRGLRVLVGRARHQASALSSGLRSLGAEVLEIPFIEIRQPRSYRPLDSALTNLSEYDWLILTSVNGVEALWERLQKLGFRHSTWRISRLRPSVPPPGERSRSMESR